MEFGKHIGKGIWAFADKALPAVYALGFIFLVVRVLPEREYGSFAVIQSAFLIISALGFALALQPLTKFAAETSENGPYIMASLVVNALFYSAISVAVVVFKSSIAGVIDSTGEGNFVQLAPYLPLLLLTSYYRSFAVSLLQAGYEIQKIFWIDAVYFLGTFVLIIIAQGLGRFHTAEDMITLNIYGQALSSVLAMTLTGRSVWTKLEARGDAFRKMWDFGKYSFGGNSIYTIYAQMDVFFISHFVGVLGVAMYNAAKNLTRLFDMLGQVLQMFLIPYSSKAHARGDQKGLLSTAEKAICFSTVLFLPVLLIFTIFPREVLHFLYGGRYDASAPILRIFGILALVLPWNGVVVSYMTGTGMVKQGFYFIVGLIILAVPTYALLTSSLGTLGPSIAYVSIFSFFTVILTWYLRRLVTLTPRGVYRRVSDIASYVKSKYREFTT
jgi:O-antigen/teichoic acid export membrane protein